jgi:hypothetical protein
MSEQQINRQDLQWQLAKTAMLKSLAVMGFCVAILFGFALVLPLVEVAIGEDWVTVLFLAAFFGLPSVLDLVLRRTFCRNRVRCPFCQASLWTCGTGNFKPRRMKVRADVHACPQCQTPIV